MAGKYTRQLTEAASIDGDTLVAVSEDSTDDLYKTTLNTFSKSFDALSVSNTGNTVATGTVTKGSNTQLFCSSSVDFDNLVVGSMIIVLTYTVSVEKKIGTDELTIYPAIVAPITAESFTYSDPYASFVASNDEAFAYFNDTTVKIDSHIMTGGISATGSISASVNLSATGTLNVPTVSATTVGATTVNTDNINATGTIITTDLNISGDLSVDTIEVDTLKPSGTSVSDQIDMYSSKDTLKNLHVSTGGGIQTPRNEFFRVSIGYGSWSPQANVTQEIPFDNKWGVGDCNNNDCYQFTGSRGFKPLTSDSLVPDYTSPYSGGGNRFGFYIFGCNIYWNDHTWGAGGHSILSIAESWRGDYIARDYFRVQDPFAGEFSQTIVGTWFDIWGPSQKIRAYIKTSESGHTINEEKSSFWGARLA